MKKLLLWCLASVLVLVMLASCTGDADAPEGSTAGEDAPSSEEVLTTEKDPTGSIEVPSESQSEEPSESQSEEPSESETVPPEVPAVPERLSVTVTEGLTYALLDDGTWEVTGVEDRTIRVLVIPEEHEGRAVTRIGSRAFDGCDRLLSVTLPSTLTSADEISAFEDSYNVREVINHSTLPVGSERYDGGCVIYFCLFDPYHAEIHTGESRLYTLGDYLFYHGEKGTVLLEYTGTEQVLRLPAGFEGASYTIARDAFRTEQLLSVTVPAEVEKIEYGAFVDCQRLYEVVNNSVLPITKGSDEQGGIARFAREVHAGESRIRFYGGGIFYPLDGVLTLIGHTEWKTAVSLTLPTLPDGEAYAVGESALSASPHLARVTVPPCVTTLGKYAFSRCASLASVTLSEGITVLDAYAFYDCDALTSLTIPETVTRIGDSAFSQCDLLAEIVLPARAELLGIGAFSGCASLRAVAIPAGITELGAYLFSGCVSLVEVTVPESVTRIGDSAFSACTRLTSVNLPAGVTKIANATFYGCSRLASLSLPEALEEIGERAFAGCYSLAGLEIPESVRRIGAEAFRGCQALVETVDGVSYVDTWAIYLGAVPALGVTDDGNFGFEESETPDEELPASVTLRAGTRGIADSAFEGRRLLASISLPRGILYVGRNAFLGCTSLADVTFDGSPEEWERIGIAEGNEVIVG